MVALLSCAVLASPFATSGVAQAAGVPSCNVPGQITPHPINWYSIRVPGFSTGTEAITDYAVEPLVADRLYVTNGTVVMRSVDAGCHWTQVFALPATGNGMNAANSRILEIEVGGPGAVYLPIQQAEPAPQPHVVVSTDGGSSWNQADGPVMNTLVGRIRDLDVSLGNGAAAAMLLDVELSEPGVVGAEGQQVLLTTTSSGTTWDVGPGQVLDSDTRVTTPVASVSTGGGREMTSIAVNPVRPNEVWLYGPNGVSRYDGATMNDTGLGATTVLDIAMDGRAVLAYSSDSNVGKLSLDGGVSFVTIQSGFPVDSIDIITSTPTEIATGSYGRVLTQTLFPGQARPQLRDISPQDGRAVTDVQVAFPNSVQRPSVYTRTSNTIEVVYEPKGEIIKPQLVSLDLTEPHVDDGNNKLMPASKTVSLRPGQSRTIDYELNLPGATTPLDVYFMIDISGSMQGTINGIRAAMQDIADRLAHEDIDVNFGVGSFRSYDTPPAYKRERDIGPTGPELAAALNRLTASGGGDETQMAALLQSVTGEGDGSIPPGLNMHFRRGSLPVAIMVTDEPISQGPPHPTYDAVIDALNAHGVEQVGLAIQEPPLLGEQDYGNPGPAAQGLRRVADGTDTVAPYGGVDCDGDGDIDIPAGVELVCFVDPNHSSDAGLMADAIVNIVSALQDVRQLDVQAGPKVSPTSESEVVTDIAPDPLPPLDLKKPSAAQFSLTVTCPHVPRKTVFPIEVGVASYSRTFASAELDVVCVPIMEKAEVLTLFSAFVPIAAVPPPPPRPPDPVPEPNPNPQPNPQQNPQAQAGFAAQEQQQPQLALANQEGAAAPEVASEGAAADDFYMSDNSERRIPPIGFIFTTATITCLGGYLVMARERTRTAPARNRRGRRH